MDVLLEVHTQVEAEMAIDSGADLIGINNRNLGTLTENLSMAESLMPQVAGASRGNLGGRQGGPSALAVAESGFKNR
ncbi:hypothetical protein ABTL37_19785, partial [Acinetobacter baumannii]